MNAVIVEDEKLSAEHLTLLLHRLDIDIKVINYFDSVKATSKAFNEGLQADLLFLDIHLADGNSFEIFPKTKIDIPIIFTTAYDNYAIQAFKQNSVDYLLKPISLTDLRFTLEKFKKQQEDVIRKIQDFDEMKQKFEVEERVKQLKNEGARYRSFQIQFEQKGIDDWKQNMMRIKEIQKKDF